MNFIHYLILSMAIAISSLPAHAAKPKRQQTDAVLNTALASISEDAARAHVYFLADDLLEGRQAGKRGARIAQQYIIAQMRQWGIQPLLKDDYLQHFEAYARICLHRNPRFFVEADSIASIRQKEHYALRMANVVGVIPGVRTDEYVVVGAHLDHEGMNADLAGDAIYNGADDNASGVSAVLQIMRAFAVSGAKPLRTIVFAFWDGEELGLLGSRLFCERFGNMEGIKAYLNFDMVGGNNRPDDPPYFVYFYTAAHPAFGTWLRYDIDKYKLQLHPDYRPWDNPVGGSDQGSFARHNVPVVWYHTDAQPHYNTPSDEAHTINYPKLTDITRASLLTTWHMANDDF